MATAEVSLAIDPANYLGETPLWNSGEQALYWINCENPPQVHRWDPQTEAHAIWPMPQRVGGIAFQPSGKLVVVLSDGIYDFDKDTGELALRVRSPLPSHVSLHECQCDRQGRLWVGSYDHNFSRENRDAGDGSIFRLDGDTLVREIGDINVANGMAFSPDGVIMYVSDSPTRTVEAYDLDPITGKLSNGRPFLQLQDGEGFVDGATVDAEGGYWLAAVGAGALRRYLPDGRLDRVIQLPVSNPTKPAFGGAALDTLYVTTTRLNIGAGSEANGGIYAHRPGVCGIAEPQVLSEENPDP